MAYVITDRLHFLAEASKILSSSLDYHVTLANVAKLITDNLADFCMIDLLDRNEKMQRVAARAGNQKDRELANRTFNFPADPKNKGAVYEAALTGKTILIERLTEAWLKTSSRIPEEKEITKKLGMRSFIFAPLKSRNKVIGVLTLVSSKKDFSYDEDDVILAQELANRAAIAVDKAQLYLQAQEALKAEKRLAYNLRFLSKAGEILSSSLDYKTTLQNVAKLAVSYIADWCAIDIINEEGKVELVAVVHKDPEKVKWAQALRKQQPVNMSSPTGIPQVLRSGKSELYPSITKEMIVRVVKRKKELELIKKLNLSSVMLVPIIKSGKSIGVISFIASESGRNFDKNSLATAEELARRSSIAIENASLYKETREALRAREEFMSIAAHELNTPLTIILLHLQKANSDIKKLMKEHTGMEKVLDLLEKSEKQGFRLSKLINDLLDVSLLSTGKLTLEKEETELNELVEETIVQFKLRPNRKSVKILFEKSKSPVNGMWDKIRLEQVILNLLSNAVKYGDGKPIEVTVGKNKKNALLTIKDQGIGIRYKDRKSIFGLFNRGALSGNHTGIGIGLYISKQIIDSHRGTIDFKSKIGKGTAFKISLPLGS